MRRCIFALITLLPLLAMSACRESGRVSAASLHSDGILRVTVMGSPSDPRTTSVREAVAFWNSELARLGLHTRLDSVALVQNKVSDNVLRGAGAEVKIGRGPRTARLRANIAEVPGDIIIALSNTDLISYGVPWRENAPGVVAIRRSDVPPLSLPNTSRNVIAHEIGHVLGLQHNDDAASLMCGRPATCRPAVFASNKPRFFPLTTKDVERLRSRWP